MFDYVFHFSSLVQLIYYFHSLTYPSSSINASLHEIKTFVFLLNVIIEMYLTKYDLLFIRHEKVMIFLCSLPNHNYSV